MGINQQLDAALKIEFGREVLLDKVILTLRADFPHDNYWQQVTLKFSDGTHEVLKLLRLSNARALPLRNGQRVGDTNRVNSSR